MASHAASFGSRLRDWRSRRRMSQLALALESEISARHLSFLETGRACPSRAMVLRIAETLGLPLRERNLMLASAGFAPVYGGHALSDPALQPAAEAVRLVLAGHMPFPALAIDRHWNLIEANAALACYLAGVAPALLAPPVNVLKLSLHPEGLGARIVNHGAWRAHVLARLARTFERSGDAGIGALIDEIERLPRPPRRPERAAGGEGGILLPVELETAAGRIAMFSTTTVFGSPLDVTLDEIAIETFFPADPLSRERMIALAAASSG
ncbi:helix-turn-helix domain-containing protein [Erythrobacter sp. NE805]|uniref:helix-turn-helix domain-containing protein n=1 Tax=Erythrobacter sp. NE805 TaxID=3389875 RepID=UPI00396B2A87